MKAPAVFTAPLPASLLPAAFLLSPFLLSAPAAAARPSRGAADVKVVTVPSQAMGGRWPAAVVLPAAYRTEPRRRFPVLYLLHGVGDDHWKWVRATSLTKLLETHPVICVCPNGRANGWFLDSPRVENSNVETHITRELVPFVDANFRTIAAREARGICGNSMGGHGAVTLAARHPDLFASASSLSGIMDITRWPDNWNLPEVLGPYRSDPRLWRSHSAFGSVEAFTKGAQGVSLFVDCGVDDYAYGMNLEFHGLLKRSGVRHAYMEKPGSHSWAYWSGQLAHHLHFHLKSFEEAESRAREPGKRAKASTPGTRSALAPPDPRD